MQCKLVFQASVADSHLSFVWRVNFNWSWLICLYFGNRASPLASATASEPRVVWLFKFLNWPSFSNLSTRMRLTQVAVFWTAHSSEQKEEVETQLTNTDVYQSIFLIQECLLIPLWLNNISMLEKGRLPGWQSGPQMIKNIFQDNLREEGDFHEKWAYLVGLFGPSCGRIRQMLITHIYIYIGIYICSSIDDLVPWSLGWTQHYRACLPHTNVCVSTSFSQYHLQNKSFAQPPLGPPE